MAIKQNFEMHPDLLKSVIFQQAGSVEKAILEAIQNSLDEDSKSVRIFLNEKGFTIIDDGNGMDAEQIDVQFKIFGNSIKKNDPTKRGKFAMGRGQIFAFGYTKWFTLNNEMRINAIRSLSYRMKESKEYIKGTEIRCLFYKKLDTWELDRTIAGIKRNVIPSKKTNITINNQDFGLEKEIIGELSNDDFEVFTTNLYNNRIFAQDLYIKNFDSTTILNIACKNKMKVNMARNSFIEDDDMTVKLYELIKNAERLHLLSVRRFDATLGKTTLQYIHEGKLTVKDFKKKKMIEMADGTLMSLEQLAGKKVMFGGKNRTSDKAIQEGYTVINDQFEYLIGELSTKKENGFSLIIDERRPCDVIKEGYHREIDPEALKLGANKKAVYIYYWTVKMNYELFGDKRQIIIGESDSFKGWTDGYDYICVDKKLFTKTMDKRARMNEVFELLVHEYSHENDDTNETAHDSNFYKRYHDLMSSKLPRVGFFLRDYDYSDIKKEYGYEVEDL